MKKTTTGFTIALCLVVALGAAYADVAEQVQKAFAGQILITTRALSDIPADEAKPVAAYEKARAKALVHTEKEGVAEWSFHYAAFLKKAPKVTMLSMDFYTDDKEKLYVANKRIGVDPEVTIVSGKMTISEDDGLAKGRSYIVKLTGEVKGKEVVFATTNVSTK